VKAVTVEMEGRVSSEGMTAPRKKQERDEVMGEGGVK